MVDANNYKDNKLIFLYRTPVKFDKKIRIEKATTEISAMAFCYIRGICF